MKYLQDLKNSHAQSMSQYESRYQDWDSAPVIPGSLNGQYTQVTQVTQWPWNHQDLTPFEVEHFVQDLEDSPVHGGPWDVDGDEMSWH